jgi:hypothetical protein
LRKIQGHYFIRQLPVITSCGVVYRINLCYLSDLLHAGRSDGSYRLQLSNKIRTVYDTNMISRVLWLLIRILLRNAGIFAHRCTIMSPVQNYGMILLQNCMDFFFTCQHLVMFLYNKTNQIPISQIYSSMKLYMFRAVPLPIIRSLFTVHSALVYVIHVLQTCITYTSAECTVNKLLMMGRGTDRNM